MLSLDLAVKPGRSCVTKPNCFMFISFQEVLNSQAAVPFLTFIITKELCGKATFLPHICSVITREREEKGGGHRKGERLGCPGCSDARGMCTLLIQCRDNWYVLASGA